MQATAVAHPNIALIKYWGNRDETLRLPANGSISMTMGQIETRVAIEFSEDFTQDNLKIDGVRAEENERGRVSQHLDLLRRQAGTSAHAEVETHSNFPRRAGIASSASAFAALTLAAAKALGLEPTPQELTTLARQGSGSASRSILGGYVEWLAAKTNRQSHCVQIAPENHWELTDVVAVVDRSEKAVGSTEGHRRAPSSLLQAPRVADTPRRLDLCRSAILKRNFEALAAIAEADAILMHAVMMTSQPSLHYWTSDTLLLMRTIPAWRAHGMPVFYTIDAGPNVHCLCPTEEASNLTARLADLNPDWTLFNCPVGMGARLA